MNKWLAQKVIALIDWALANHEDTYSPQEQMYLRNKRKELVDRINK
ncbi:MAG: hypothetical protein ACXW0J_02805 [Nitrososphaeraceae archaeon]